MLKQLHLGNIANVAYAYSKLLRQAGHDASVLCYDFDHIFSQPEWMEGDFCFAHVDENCFDPNDPQYIKCSPPAWYQRIKSKDYFWKCEPVDSLLLLGDDWKETLISKSIRFGPRWTLKEEDIIQFKPLVDALAINFFQNYDVIFGYAYAAIPPLLWSVKPYIAVEIGTMRDLPFEDSAQGRLLALAYRTAPHVIITNPDVIASANELGIENYTFVPHPVDEEIWKPLPDEEKPRLHDEHGAEYLLCAPECQDWQIKGNHKYLKAFAEIVKDGLNAKILIPAWGQDVMRSRNLVKDLGIDENVIWLDPQPERKLVELYNSVDLVLDQFGSCHTFGLVAPKAMVCGTPVILSYDPAIHEWCFQEHPPVIAADNEKEIYQALKRYLTCHEERSDLSRMSKEWFAVHHSKAVVVKKINKILESVRSGGRSESSLFDSLRHEKIRLSLEIQPTVASTPATQVVTPLCHLPWQSMVINADGVVMPCAYWMGYGTSNPPCGNLNDSHLLEIWNGEVYQELRRNMTKGNLEAAGCSKCFALQQGIPMGMMYDPDADLESPPQSEYAKHLKLLRKEIADGKTVLESNPTVISLTPSHQCNLRCIHCYQTITRDCTLVREECIDEIFGLLPTLFRITAGGGEPFLLPLWKRFLGDADISVNPYLEFAVSTNATLVSEKLINDLRRFKRLLIAISFDGATKEVYEKIRIGASFENVVRNIDKFINLTRDKPGSHVSLDISVMKANIRDLPNLIQFAARKEVTFSLLPVMDMPSDQTITRFNNPILEMTGWKAAIDKSYRIFDEIYAERLSNLEKSCRDSHRNHIAIIEKTIPWGICSQDHFLVTGELSQALIDLYIRGYGRDLVVAFWTLNGTRPEACHYYSHLDGNQYQVYLPAGDYALEVHTRIFPPRFVPCSYIRVSQTGKASKSYPMVASMQSLPLFLRSKTAKFLPKSVKNLLKRLLSIK